MPIQATFEANIDAIVDSTRAADRIVFFTGAGISAESGLPTYRGIGGLYNDITVDEGFPIEVVLSATTFAEDPALTWKYIAEIEKSCRGAGANSAHKAITAIEAYAEVWVVTQNVDGFHRDSGSANVIELHGNLHDLMCLNCRHETRVVDYAALSIPPSCERCSGLMRPSVVLFEEALPSLAVAAFEKQFSIGFDMYFAIGTTAAFPYIYEPFVQASRDGIPTVEINPDETSLSNVVRYSLREGAVVSLNSIIRNLE